ncbi:unnamed protein product [Thlaspi arvense]|uniref:Uncharacterized protein n=1 Tax=Thlaspi arvense TaxID=13288 RepID=A0AAU9R5W9_THLAR|nr:unnamed protein product [Thlaspi arvense]
MEIASTSRAFDLFPTDERFKIKDAGINFSFFSVNPKFDDPEKLSRTGRDRKERCDVVTAAPRKRKYSVSDEEKPEKRQKKAIDAFKSKDTQPVAAAKFRKPEPSVRASIRVRGTKTNWKVKRLIPDKSLTTSSVQQQNLPRSDSFHDTKTTPKVITTKPGEKVENQNHSLKDLVAKAREKLQEKRQIDHGMTCIARQRIAARLAREQVVATVAFDDHLDYHTELEQLGCDFIHDQVSCLSMFNLLSRSDYIDDFNSVLEKKEMPRSG